MCRSYMCRFYEITKSQNIDPGSEKGTEESFLLHTTTGVKETL